MIHPVLFLSMIIAVAAQTGQTGQKEPSSEARPPAFKWLAASGETAGVRLETHKLDTISPTQYGSAAEAEKETVPIGTVGTRTTTRVFDTDPNGARVLVETVVEEIRNLAGGRTEAVRTVSRRDANGRMPVVGKYTQETTLTGTDSYQTRLTVQLAGSPGGALVPVEQVVQTERTKSPNETEIDRTQLVLGANATWVTRERRNSATKKSGSQVSTDEAVYSPDANGNLQLSTRIASREWKDSRENEQREITTYRSDLAGRLTLDNRVQLSRENLGGGAQQTTQIVNGANPAAPSEGMRLIQKIIETIQPSGPDAIERSVSMLNHDLNGQTQTVYTLRTVTIK